ncbi:MAG: N-acetyl-gamma-glutamyl-phosphate reductase [Coriobacteriia bacterium]|nr:N-acetyl-gamma-glutamyl-phosphate reductase [Coriobacteriia bacterium]
MHIGVYSHALTYTRRVSIVIPVAVIGAAGYAGAELTRLVLGHPSFELKVVTSGQDEGRLVRDLYPALAGCELAYTAHSAAAVAEAAKVAFLAVPHTAAMALAPALLDAGLTVVDCSADFRLRDPDVFTAWYAAPHTAIDLLEDAVYGLPELWRDLLPGTRLVACPGCYPTATLLAAAPAVRAGVVVSQRVVVDAISGVSGAGRSLSQAAHFVNATESVEAYKVGSHRHTPEIAQALADLGLQEPTVVFTPHLAPLDRGLLSTVYLEVDPTLSAEEAHAIYSEAYAGEPFVTVCEPGVQPATGHVRGSNRAHIGVVLDVQSGTLIVTCAIDNLVKGTAGQAVQCANIALGLDETAGLSTPGAVV